MFVNMGVGEEDCFIFEILEMLLELKDMFKSIIKVWREGNIQKIDEVVVDIFKCEFFVLYDDVFIKCN